MTNFNNENGLPQSSVSFAEMDGDGYLWLATQAGIVRYDGQRFRLFNNTNSPLVRNRYCVLGKDTKGRIYCIDDFGSISFYNSKTGFSKPSVRRMLAPTADGGLIDLNQFDFREMTPYINRLSYGANAYGLLSKYYKTVNGKGFLTFAIFLSGYVSNNKVRKVDSLDFHTGTHFAIASIGTKLFYINRKREFVLVDSSGARTYQTIPFAMPWRRLLNYYPAVTLHQQGDQVLLNVDGDIYEVALKGDKLEFRLLISIKDVPYITCIRYYPEQNLLIVGSNSKGLFLFKKEELAAAGKNNENPNAFYALAPYGDTQVVATTGTLPRSPRVLHTRDALNRYSILRDRGRYYWYSSGLALLRTDDRFRVLKRIPLSAWLSCVQEDEQGAIWIVEGAYTFGRVQADSIQHYQLKNREEKNIECFIPAGDQTFWLVGRGLCMWLDVKHHRQRIYHEFDKIELRTVLRDKQGNVWLGSYGQGYFLFRNGRFTKMPEDEMRYLKVVHSFLEDSKGFLWMTTNNGLFQCAVNDLIVMPTEKQDRYITIIMEKKAV